MYSPKIREDLIPKVYQAAKKAGLAMTEWVNRVIEGALRDSGANQGPETNDGNQERRDSHESRRA